jgi:hypothetical protein
MDDLTSKISSKLINIAKCELKKKETKDYLDSFKDQVFVYILKVIHPYIVCIILIMLTILCLQGYVVSKLIHVHSEIISMK